MTSKVIKNTVGGLAWILPAIPLVTLLTFSLYALLVYFEIGRMPIAMEDNYPDSLRFFDDVAGFSLVILWASFLLVLVSSLLPPYKPFVAKLAKPIKTYFIVLSIVILILIFTPLGGFIEWYLD